MATTLLCSALAAPAAETFDCCPADPSHPETTETAAAVPGLAPPRLHLVWSDPLGALPFSFGHVARELESALRVSVTWRAALPQFRQAPHEILVVLLDGAPSGRLGSKNVMGSTSKRRASKVLWVVLRSVKRTLEPGSGAHRLSRSELARAIARVVAHEVVHVVAPALPHAPKGLMRDRLGREDLLRTRLWLDPETRHALREALDAYPEPSDWAAAVARPSPRGISPPGF